MRRIKPFEASLAASTAFAFGTLAVAYAWSAREIALDFAREKILLNSVATGVDYESMTLGLATGVTLVFGLAGFASTAILGITRRPWSVTALVLAPLSLWMVGLVIAFVGLAEEYFP